MIKKEPQVLLYDLETFPNIGYTWSKWETNVIKFVKEWEIASFAYKWLGQSKVSCKSRATHTEEQLVQMLHKLFSQADILVAHNGDSFDVKKARVKFAQFNLDPPALNRTVDTKKIAKSQFAFNSNSLNDLGETLKLGKKVDTGGFDLWLRCMEGEKKAWALMEKYNMQDVVLLEKVYLKLRAWAPHHPSLALLKDREGCPACGSAQTHSRGIRVTTKQRQYRYQCQSCGHWFTGKKPTHVTAA